MKNFYDSTMVTDDDRYLDLIPQAVEFLNYVYKDEFYLQFEMDGEPVRNPNAAVDICDNGTALYCRASTESNCAGVCSQHHKNVHRIANDLYDRYFERDHVIVSWSNCPKNIYCQAVGGSEEYGRPGQHTTIVAAALVTLEGDRQQPVVQFLSIKEYVKNSSPETVMAITIAHEIAHTLGLDEVYNDSYGDCSDHDGADGLQCVMENFSAEYSANAFYEGVKNGTLSGLCDYCIEKLHSEISADAYES